MNFSFLEMHSVLSLFFSSSKPPDVTPITPDPNPLTQSPLTSKNLTFLSNVPPVADSVDGEL